MNFINHIQEWEKQYDFNNYPYDIYSELVIDGKDSLNRITILGAWKAGNSLIITGSDDYIYHSEISGNKYQFSNRWREDCPVGFTVWNDLNNNYQDYLKSVPEDFPEFTPEIISDLCARNGFGFIWSVFFLHCCYPKIYPLYDQHVYRAYKFNNEGNVFPGKAPDSWEEYSKYRDYFNKLLQDSGLEQAFLDRALWSFGKYLKPTMPRERRLDDKSSDFNSGHSWVHDLTINGKAFWWRYDGLELKISRIFRSAIKEYVVCFSNDDLVKISNYFKGNVCFGLANNVTKLNNNEEKDGVGRFLYSDYGLGWKNTTKSQSASHLAVIFIRSGFWSSIGKRPVKLSYVKDFSQDELLSAYKGYLESGD